MKSAGSFLHSISESRPFVDNWQPLLEHKTLYVPIFDTPYTENALNSDSALFDWIDVSHREVHTDFRISDVFLSEDAAPAQTQLQGIGALRLLQRLLKNHLIQGVCFHSTTPFSEQGAHGDSEWGTTQQTQRSSYTLYRFALARLVGLLELQAQGAAQVAGQREKKNHHLVNLQSSFENDQLSSALYLAAQAREVGWQFEEYFPIEMGSLLGLGLYQHAATYLQWAGQSYPKNALAFQAHLLSVSGFCEQAYGLLQLDATQSWHARLELGRALLFSGQAERALTCFDSCLAETPQHFDPLLGRGVSLRACGWDTLNSEYFDAARSCFEQIIAKSGYHSAEAYHHLGTIYMAKEEYEKAEEMFTQASNRALSPVSKRNLCLVLHAQGRLAEAYQLFSFLYTFFPDQAIGLEKYFQQRPRLIVIAGEPPCHARDISDRAESIRALLRSKGIVLKGDMLDFKRIDAYINYYAPSGTFIESSKLGTANTAELAHVFGELSRLLAHTLVREGHAYWASSPSAPAEQLQIITADSNAQPQVLPMYQVVLERLRQGAESDATLMLESLVSSFQDYQPLLDEYINPYPALPADDERVAVFEARAAQAVGLLEEYGFFLRKNLDDLFILDQVVDAMLVQHTTLADACAEGRFTNEELLTLGLYLGSLCRKKTSGIWYDHHDGFGISLQEMSIEPVYPIWRIFKRVEAGPGGDGFSNIAALHPSIICAELIRYVRKEGITSLKEIQTLLSQRLPSLAHPQAVEHLSRTILRNAGKKNY